MMKALLRVRFRALFAGITAQSRKKNHKRGVGTILALTVLYLYVAAVILGVMGYLFNSLVEPYYAAGLDWLYFSMAGLMALGFSVLGSVFTTQSQLYDAKDNELLLAMPIAPSRILLSRMIPLMALNLLFGALVLLPAIVVYAVYVGWSFAGILCQIVALFAIMLLAQAIACLFGWLLHLLLRKMNKSVASILYLVVFLGLYFYIYSQASNLLQAMQTGSEVIAEKMHTWVWPLYAMGQGCLGSVWMLLAFVGICAAAFALVYAMLSATFLHSTTVRSSGGKKRRKLAFDRVHTPMEALIRKEGRKFLGCPVYLTNMGLGVILVAAMAVLGLVFRERIQMFLDFLDFSGAEAALIICAVLTYVGATILISTPSVSLEGKNIWILRSMPLRSADILRAKLYFHCWVSVPVTALAGLVLGIAYCDTAVEMVLTTIVPALVCVLGGVLGMAAGLKWARLDYISEAYPCKQSISVLVTMFGMMGLPLVLGLLYGFWLNEFLRPAAFLAIVAVCIAAVCCGLFRLLLSWGVRKWESL